MHSNGIMKRIRMALQKPYLYIQTKRDGGYATIVESYGMHLLQKGYVGKSVDVEEMYKGYNPTYLDYYLCLDYQYYTVITGLSCR